MTDLTPIFCDVIRKQLLQLQIEVVQIVPLPPPSDRGQRMKVLQELNLEPEEKQQAPIVEYWVQLRSLSQTPRTQVQSEVCAPKPSLDGIYLPNGKLNIPFLMKNAELLFDAGDYVLARRIYKSILQSGEYTAIVLYRLGRCFEAEERFEDACAKYEESIVFYPFLEAYQKLAALLIRMNKSQQASEVMERAQSLKDAVASSQLSSGSTPAFRSMPRSTAQKLRSQG